jgi:hypothetical protein
MAGAYVIVGAITLGLLMGVIGWIGWLLLLVVSPIAVLIAHAMVILAFGYTLEPVAENGHIPLGESGE